MIERLQKECTGCKTIKPTDAFRKRLDKRRGSKYLNSTCKECDAAATRKYYNERKDIDEFKQKNNERSKIYVQRNSDVVREKQQLKRQKESYKENRKRYIQKNKDKIAAQEKICKERYHKRNRDELSDVYVASKIVAKTNLSRNEIPPEVIELKRAQLELQRFVNKIENEGTGDSKNA